jgi:predicted RNA binding protein YcfA (HicA-like mRNA interferase family)
MPPRLTASEAEAILRKNGFIFISQKGSHRKWRNPDSGKQVIVPAHQGRQLPIGTLLSIVKGSGLGRSVFGL